MVKPQKKEVMRVPIKVLAEKTLEFQGSTKSFDKAIAIGGDSPTTFQEKHYLPQGSVPDGVTTIKCRYYVEVDE